MNSLINSVVSLSPAFATEVNIRRDFITPEANRDKLHGYVPTSSARKAMHDILQGLHPASRKRVHLITGSYGTGKSHFGLVLANLVSSDWEDADLRPFLEKFKGKDPLRFGSIKTARENARPYLVVVTEPIWDPEGFAHSLLVALSQALDRAGIEFRPPSHFRAALECILNWQETEPEAYKKLSTSLLTHGKKTIEMVRDGLKDYSQAMYDLFEEAHKEVAFGAAFYPQISANPSVIYEETAKDLKSTRVSEGIFILCDEFGNYLTEMAKDPYSREGQQLQEFAEFCKRSGENQCHLVIIAHQTLKDYAISYRTKEEWAKIHGRFIDSDNTLAAAGSHEPEIEDMISSVVIQQAGQGWTQVSTHPDFGILADIAIDAGLYPTQLRSWIESSLVKGCYPMHPFTVYCLPWVSDKIGQRERTVFTFLSHSSEHSLRHFVDNTCILRPEDRLNLYTLDSLYDYFHEQIRAHTDYKHIVFNAEKALGLCGENDLARRIVKTISILSVVDSPSLRATKKTIADALHLATGQQQEVESILTVLVDQRVLWHRRATEVYEVPGRSGLIDAREAVDREKTALLQRGVFDLVGFLNDKFRPSDIVAYEYAEKYFVRRQATCQYIRASALSNPKAFVERIQRWYRSNRGKYEGDILILYVLADSPTDIESARNYARMEACKNPQLVISIPKAPITFSEMALELKAIESLKQAGLKVEEGTIDDEDIKVINEEALHAIQSGIGDFIRADNLEWHCDGNVVANLQRDDEQRFVSTLLKQVLVKTPSVKDDATANPIFTTDKDKKGRWNAMDTLLNVSGAFQVKKAGGSPADRIIRSCLKDTELLEKVGDKLGVAEFEVREIAPPNSALAEIWQFMCEKVVANGGKVTMLTELVEPLIKPPYGLSNQLMEIILAAFLRNRRDDSVVFSNVKTWKKTKNEEVLTQVQLNGASIANMVYDPEDFVVYYYEIKPDERDYLHELVRILGVDESLLSAQGLWEGTKSALIDWYNRLPRVTRSAQDFPDSQCTVLLEVLGNSEKTRRAKEFLLNYLPEALGFDLTQKEELLDQFQRTYDELNGYVRSRAAALFGELAKVFNARGSTEAEVGEAARQWYNEILSEFQRIHNFVENERHLLEAVCQEGPISESLLCTLPYKMGLGPYTDWDSESSKDLFIARLELAKKNVEIWQPDYPGGQPQPQEELQARASSASKRILALFDELGIPPSTRREILERLLKELG